MTRSLTARQERHIALAAMVGGGLMVIGAFLPWLSLYAGLHPLRGVIGLNGRIVAAGGLACLIAGVVAWLRPRASARRIAVGLGCGVAGFTSWLIVQQFILYRELSPMLVPRLGVGLFVALAGSVLVAAIGLPSEFAAGISPAERRIVFRAFLPSRGRPS
jgi:hypothetical protein